MIKEIILAILVSFFISAIIGPRMLPLLMRLKFGQFVRDDGPQSHLKKQGTPTMGGLIFFVPMIVTSAIFFQWDDTTLPLLFITLGFGVIGFIDDYLKVVKKQSEGLKAYQKLLLQLIVAVGFLGYLVYVAGIDTDIIIPFTSGYTLELGWLYMPFMLVVILGTVNGVNLTDGLDGLSTSVTSVVAMFFVMLSLLFMNSGGVYAAIVFGSLLGFLLLNVHPAKVFMGDTGSLALGGYVAAAAIIAKMPLFILLFGIIYLCETLSVMIQVVYYKKTKKRFFKMAPIHHHFELTGMSEPRIVVYFTTVTVIMCLISLLAL
jgi:phospho-N-acetylmuramoyl-pentapeptide-transferase